MTRQNRRLTPARIFAHIRDVTGHAAGHLGAYAPGYAAALRALPVVTDGPSLRAWRSALVAARDAWHTSLRYAAEREAISAAPDGGMALSIASALDVLAIEAGFALLAGEIDGAFLAAVEACDPRPTRLLFVRAWRRAGAQPVAID